MGFDRLRLVAPCRYLTQEALARASGADGIVREASVHETLEQAIADCQLVFGTSARARSLEWNAVSAAEAAGAIAGAGEQQLAIVFGRERSGLTNDELSLCTHRIFIPANPSFSSLNLAAAVQIVAYEIATAVAQSQPGTAGEDELPVADEIADSASMQRFYQHLESTLVDIRFLDPANPRLLMQRLRRYFGRSRPTNSEMNILRGILTEVQRSVRD